MLHNDNRPLSVSGVLTLFTFIAIASFGGGPAAAQSNTAMAVRINGAALTADRCMQPWIDGTQVCVSAPSNQFTLMTFNHPQQQRWVVQYANESRHVTDGGQPFVSPGYDADILSHGNVIATYQIAVHSMGQEWSHVEGTRKPLRTPADLVEAGDVPRHQSHGPLKRLATYRPYKPLHITPLTPFMPAQGGHPEVHWTTSLSVCLLSPGECGTQLENIKISAEALAGFQMFMRHKGAQHPVDFRSSYYVGSSFGRAQWSKTGKAISFVERAKPQPAEASQGKFDRGIMPDTPHLACPAWEQYRLDGDPYHLRNLQFCANVSIGFAMVGPRSFGSKDGKPALVPSRLQSRGYGKGLMLLWRAFEYTPEGSWEWLAPKAYFEQALKDSEAQVPYLTALPDSKFGKLQQDYLDARPFDSIEGISHMDMQATWTVGWMVAKGWAGFTPLFDALTQGTLDNFEAMNVAMIDFQPWANSGKRKALKAQWGGSWQKATQLFLQDRSFSDLTMTSQHIWKEQRYEGIATSLVQLGFEEWLPIAQALRNNRRKWYNCANGGGCPTRKGYDVMPADWSFSLSATGPDKAASVAPAQGSQTQTARAGKNAPGTTSSMKERSASGTQTAQNAAPRGPAAKAQNYTPPSESGLRALPDPGLVTLPEAGFVSLPDPGTVKLPN